jgi:hypothetical protein
MTVQIVELVDVQVLFGQEVLNVFHFFDSTGVLVPSALAAGYVANVLPSVVPLQTTALSHTAVRYRNVYPTQTLQQTLAVTPSVDGVETGDPLASCDAASAAWALGSGTVNLVGGTLPHIKRGGVRIAGMTEGNVVGNSVVPGYTTAWNTWFAALLDGGVTGWELVVATFLNAARARQHTVQQYTIVTGTSAPSPSTQNSRKVLRGRTR